MNEDNDKDELEEEDQNEVAERNQPNDNDDPNTTTRRMGTMTQTTIAKFWGFGCARYCPTIMPCVGLSAS